MYSLRRAALRLLSSPSVSIASRPRTYASFAQPVIRPARYPSVVQFQRRWASEESAARKEGEEAVPVSHSEPSMQDEVEEALAKDNASDHAPDSAAAQNVSMADMAAAQQQNHQPASNVVPPQSAPQFAGSATPKPTIFVGNLFFDVVENDLEKEFTRFGRIQNIRIIRDSRGLSKGFGYVHFETTEQAQAAIDDLNQQLFEGRRMNVQFAQHEGTPPRPFQDTRSRQMNPESQTLFIGNMAFDMTDRDINSLFKGIRNIVDVRVAIDRRTGQARGFAHADFTDTRAAKEALQALQGREVYGRRLRVDFSYGPSTAPKNRPPMEEL